MDTGLCVRQIITSYDFRISIGKDCESVSLALRETTRLFRRVDADRNWTNAYFVELTETSFNTPQLGVA